MEPAPPIVHETVELFVIWSPSSARLKYATFASPIGVSGRRAPHHGRLPMLPRNFRVLSNERSRWLSALGAVLALQAGMSEAVTAPADSAHALCGFVYAPTDFSKHEFEDRPTAAVTCADPRFGSISSEARVSGTELGARVGIDWNASPPERVPTDDQYSGMARASLCCIVLRRTDRKLVRRSAIAEGRVDSRGIADRVQA